MYPAYSLYPNGAIMICEDASEYDSNLPTPEEKADVQERLTAPKPVLNTAPPASDEPPTVDDAKLKVVAVEKTVGPFLDNPILMVSSKLKDIYNKVVVPAMNIAVNPQDAHATIEKIEWCISAANTMANSIRTILAVTSGINRVYRDCLCYEYMAEHLGFMLKNAEIIKNVTQDSYNYTVNDIDAFNTSWGAADLVSTIYDNPSILDRPMNFRDLSTISGTNGGPYAPIAERFINMKDMLECIFNQPQRLYNMMNPRIMSISRSDLLSYDRCNLEISVYPEDTTARDFRNVLDIVLRLTSTTLRQTCVGLYDLICRLTDEDEDKQITAAVCDSLMKRYMIRTINVFGIGVIAAASFASSINTKVTKTKAIRSYVDMIVSAIKSTKEKPAEVEVTVVKPEPAATDDPATTPVPTPPEAQPAS